ncbi:hypothetical protein OEA41_007539 [Lepraria neglecta]|uniref:Rhodopsin domain-containing protein n=1 Tax=Lepraria neglecta TaxID=209136 RepID=A0AAE0DN10_9LECA|nr:hypothetical protein OEA41_007539 [Lepraria neglecta]
MIWRLQMAPQRKVALTVIFGLGFIVCGVSIFRVVLATQMNKADFTYNEAKLGIITNLEAYLGIIIACLSMFPPTLKKMLGNKAGPDSRNVISSSVARLRFKSSRPRLFRKFDDLYPLTDLEGTQNEITGPDGKLNSSVEDSTIKMHHQSAIKVKQDWDFRSDSAI